MNLQVIIGWGLAVAAIALGYVNWGWQGVLLGLTVVIFWMLLQFSRVMRVLRKASQGPLGEVPSAVMLHAKLNPGMRLLEILPLTRSLGERVADDPETFAWRDAGGDRVVVELVGGRLAAKRLERVAEAAEAAPAAPAPGPASGSAN